MWLSSGKSILGNIQEAPVCSTLESCIKIAGYRPDDSPVHVSPSKKIHQHATVIPAHFSGHSDVQRQEGKLFFLGVNEDPEFVPVPAVKSQWFENPPIYPKAQSPKFIFPWQTTYVTSPSVAVLGKTILLPQRLPLLSSQGLWIMGSAIFLPFSAFFTVAKMNAYYLDY